MRALLLPMPLIFAACAGEGKPRDDDGEDTSLPPLTLPEVCPAGPISTATAGDANGDALVDVADAVWTLGAVFDEGPLPWCEPALDLVPDDRLEGDDAFALLQYLFEDLWTLPSLGPNACVESTLPVAPDCGGAELGLTATAAEGVATVTVALATELLAVTGWSLPVEAAGCTITAATTDGTAGASRHEDPAGHRDLGYDATFVGTAGASSAVVLGLMDAVALPGEALPVLVVTAVAESGCGPCTLTVGDPVETAGAPVERLVVSAGARYQPAAMSLTVETCP